MYTKSLILSATQGLVGFREDNSTEYTDLNNVAQSSVGGEFVFDAATKTITWTGNNFEDEGFAVGDLITITNSTSNNAVKTITVIVDDTITVSESLVNESTSTGTITAPSILQASSSGYYINDLPMVNFEVIQACLSKNETLKSYLNKVVEYATINVVDRFVNKVKSTLNSKELLSNQSVTTGAGSFNKLETQNARFVGYLITPIDSNNLKIQIQTIGMQCEAAQSNFKLFLYVTSQEEPLLEIPFDITKVKSLVWQTVTDAIIRYSGDDFGTGQHFILGYYEVDPNNPQVFQLQNRALQHDFDCGCSNSVRPIYSKYAAIDPIEINNDELNWNAVTGTYDIPLVEDFTNYISNLTYGLQFKINVTCDITSVLVSNIGMFSEAIQHAIAVKLLYDCYSSVDINSIAEGKRLQIKNFAMKYDGILNGYVTPENIRIKGLLEHLSIDFSDLDGYCLNCNKNSIHVGSLRL